ncbi:MAG TPA: amino acid ABC transporter substrate-binding protein [Xanthobacteraceae bacterium]|nr:amino acid ABC transporter substrate-binding protein [Xanthobacteraceae bacterium]
MMLRLKTLRFASLFAALLFSAVSASAQSTKVPSDSRLRTIIEKKAIRIAYRPDATPFSFNDKDQPAGYSVELCQAVAQLIAKQSNVAELKITWVPVTAQSRFTAISSGQADMECSSSSVTLGRMKDVDFSNYTFVESTGVVVKRAANFKSITDMAGKKIAVVAGTTNEKAIVEQSKARALNITTVSVKDRDEGVAMLTDGKVDGYASDKILLMGTELKTPDDFVMLPDDLSIEAYAITLPRGDWALRLAVNTGLAQIYRSGLVLVLFKRWFEPVGLKPGLLLTAIYALGGLSD